MPQHDRLHLCPKTPPPPSNLSLVLHCPEPTHSLTSALHHCLDFMMTFSCSYVPHVDRIHDLHLSTLFTFPFFVCDPSISSLFHIIFLLRVCLPISVHIPSDHNASPQRKPISHLTYCLMFVSISHYRSFQPRLSYQQPHQMLENSAIFRFPFPFSFRLPSTHPHSHPEHLPAPSAKTTGYHLSMTRSRFLPHAHTYISFPLRYDTASVGVIFISILVTFLELDTLAFTISKHLTIRVYCFLPIHLVNVHTAPKPRCSA